MKLSKQPGSFIIECSLALVALGFIFYFLLGSALNAQFTLTDDHVIVATVSSEGVLSPASILNRVMQSLTWGERFRPGYWFFYLAEMALFGANPAIWHWAFIGYGVLTSFFLYLAARRLGGDIISAALFILLLVATGPQNSIWYRLGTGETWGLLLTAIAIFALIEAAQKNRANIWDGVAVFFMALAGTPKESFILLIPALLLLRLTLHCWLHQQETWQQGLRKLAPVFIAGMLVFSVELFMVGMVLKDDPGGYGPKVAGLSSSSIMPGSWYHLLTGTELVKFTPYVPVLYLLLFAILWPQRKVAYPFLFATILIFLGWAIPQLILYSHNGFVFGHYLFPAIVGFAMICGLALSILWYKRLWVLWAICVIGIIWPILAGIGPTTQRSSSFTAQTLAFNEMLAYLAANVTDDQALIIVANPAAQIEWVYSMPVYLRYSGLDSPIYLLPVLPQNNSYDEAQITTVINNFAGFTTGLESLQTDQVGAIIGLSTLNSTAKVPAWFNLQDWQLLTFEAPICSFSLKDFKCVNVATYEHTILIPN